MAMLNNQRVIQPDVPPDHLKGSDSANMVLFILISGWWNMPKT